MSIEQRVDALPWNELYDQLDERGYHRVGMRHGVSTVTGGQRTALGVIFHDAR